MNPFGDLSRLNRAMFQCEHVLREGLNIHVKLLGRRSRGGVEARHQPRSNM
jgi:hypothetical protein